MVRSGGMPCCCLLPRARLVLVTCVCARVGRREEMRVGESKEGGEQAPHVLACGAHAYVQHQQFGRGQLHVDAVVLSPSFTQPISCSSDPSSPACVQQDALPRAGVACIGVQSSTDAAYDSAGAAKLS